MKELSCAECQDAIRKNATSTEALPPEAAMHVLLCRECGEVLVNAIGNALVGGELPMSPLPPRLKRQMAPAPAGPAPVGVGLLDWAGFWTCLQAWMSRLVLDSVPGAPILAPVLGYPARLAGLVRATVVNEVGEETDETVSFRVISGPEVTSGWQFHLELETDETAAEGSTVVCRVSFGEAGGVTCFGVVERGRVVLQTERLVDVPAGQTEALTEPVRVPLDALRIEVLGLARSDQEGSS